MSRDPRYQGREWHEVEPEFSSGDLEWSSRSGYGTAPVPGTGLKEQARESWEDARQKAPVAGKWPIQHSRIETGAAEAAHLFVRQRLRFNSWLPREGQMTIGRNRGDGDSIPPKLLSSDTPTARHETIEARDGIVTISAASRRKLSRAARRGAACAKASECPRVPVRVRREVETVPAAS